MNRGQAAIDHDVEEIRIVESIDPEQARDETPEGVRPTSAWLRAIPWLAAIVSIGWLAAMAWLARDAVSPADPVRLAGFVAALCAVPALLGIVWLIAARADGQHAARLIEGARALRAETRDLAATATGLAATMAASRETLAGQVEALTALGDGAAARLAGIGRGLSEEIDQADIHARALDTAAAAAEAKLSTLLATMPRARGEAEALGTEIERIGLGAGMQIAALDARLAALGERGREADALAEGGARALAAHVDGLEAATATMAAQIQDLLDRTAGSVEGSRKSLAAQGDAMLAMLETHQAALDLAARDSADALGRRIEGIGIVVDRLARLLAEQRIAGEGLAADMEGWIAEAGQRLEAMHRDGGARAEALGAKIAALGGQAEATTAAIRGGDAAAGQAIGSVETLLIALDAAAREMDETLVGALGRLDERLQETRALIAATRPELGALVEASEHTHGVVDAVTPLLADQQRRAGEIAARLDQGLATGRETAGALDAEVEASIAKVDRFVEDSAPRLLESLMRVRETATAAADRARETLATVIPEAARAMETAAADALRRAAGSEVDTRIAAIAGAAETAVSAAERAGARLEDQLARIDRSAASVEARLADDRAERETSESESFARRASLLIEALHSASIDLTRSLAPEVSDTAWTAYLKGDRGIFTRRAVRLLDATEQREVARLYDENATFRDQVNRYIHDFEAMLRTILAQRDASPLGVTILSSDIGKVYVAMAQAIERLR